MSNDLISRSAAIEEFYKRVSGDFAVDDAEKIEKVIMDVPVAYDVDRVVEQLEECKRIMESPVSQDCYNEECKVGDCIVCAFEKAIEIVETEFERCGKPESEG